jgi:hypothetical protein
MGDFNMQPYEHGMIGADRFHAVNDRRIAAGIARKVAGKSYKMFYNPCWRHLGDTVKRPGGTFYRRSSDADCVFWLMLDQVLVRPGMLPYIDDTCVSIPDLIDGVSIRKGMAMRPNDAVSDHLPLLFVSSV